MQERLIKSFIRDLSLYLQHIRVGKNIALVRTTYYEFSAFPLTQHIVE